jgi:AcrR family transcriptional regulator
MEKDGKQKRKYVSRRRMEQAQDTRERILAAALAQFSTSGYAGATIEAIAQEAGVSALTIFASFGNKRSLLAGLVGLLVGGDTQPIPILERSGPQAVLAEPDPVRKIQRFAEDISAILERVAPLFVIMRMAAKTEAEIAQMLKTILEERLLNLGGFVHNLASQTNLREGLDETRATEIVWSIASPEIYSLLTVDRGWSREYFAKWLGEMLVRLLLP